jgi:hypothetical protein
MSFNYYQPQLAVGEREIGVRFLNEKTRVEILVSNSLDQYVENVEANVMNYQQIGWNVKDLFGFSSESAQWYFGEYRTKEETYRCATTGTVKQELLNKVDKIKFDLLQKYPKLAELETHAVTKKRRRRFAEHGDEIDIDRYMSGEVECWQQSVKSPEKRSLKIMFNGAQNAGQNANTFIENIIMFAAVSDLFEKAGLSVEIWCGDATQFHYTPGRSYGVNVFKMKDANEPLDIARVLSSGLSGVFRHWSFATLRNVFKTKDAGLGTATYGSNAPVLKEAYDFLEFDFVLNAGGGQSELAPLFNKIEESFFAEHEGKDYFEYID